MRRISLTLTVFLSLSPLHATQVDFNYLTGLGWQKVTNLRNADFTSSPQNQCNYMYVRVDGTLLDYGQSKACDERLTSHNWPIFGTHTLADAYGRNDESGIRVERHVLQRIRGVYNRTTSGSASAILEPRK